MSLWVVVGVRHPWALGAFAVGAWAEVIGISGALVAAGVAWEWPHS